MRRVGICGASAVATWGLCMSARGYAEAAGGSEISVVSYNVLSPPLARPSHFKACDPDDLQPGVRLERVLKKLDAAMLQGEPVVCLQEVAVQWAGPLHKYFENKGYHFVFASYGSHFSDYMGVGIAWDASKYKSEDIEITRVANTFKDWPREEKPGQVTKFLNWILGRKRPFNTWVEASWKKNQLILARLRQQNGEAFCIGCYHMPCLFGAPEKVQVMNIHAQLVASKLHSFAGTDPYLLLGDWNIQPNSSPYGLLTTGKLADDHPETPVHPDKSWSPTVVPLRSAYKVFKGKEPLFTNYSSTGFGDFTGTLDYIWMSKGWEVKDVIDTPEAVPTKSFPTPDEPSDHILIGATLRSA